MFGLLIWRRNNSCSILSVASTIDTILCEIFHLRLLVQNCLLHVFLTASELLDAPVVGFITPFRVDFVLGAYLTTNASFAKGLCRLSESKVHRVVSLHIVVGESVKTYVVLLKRHLSSINRWAVGILVELWASVIQRSHVLNKLSRVLRLCPQTLMVVVKHDASSQVSVLIICSWPKLPHWLHKVSWTMHLLHNCSHLRCHFLLMLCLCKYIWRNSFLILALKLLLLHESVGHYSVDLLEVL